MRKLHSRVFRAVCSNVCDCFKKRTCKSETETEFTPFFPAFVFSGTFQILFRKSVFRSPAIDISVATTEIILRPFLNPYILFSCVVGQ